MRTPFLPILTFAAVKERAEEAHARSGFLGVTRVIGGNVHCHRAPRRHLRLTRPAVLDFRVALGRSTAVRPPRTSQSEKLTARFSARLEGAEGLFAF